MIRLCVEVLGFFIFLTLLINIGRADEAILFHEFELALSKIVLKGQSQIVEVVKPQMIIIKFKQP